METKSILLENIQTCQNQLYSIPLKSIFPYTKVEPNTSFVLFNYSYVALHANTSQHVDSEKHIITHI